MDINLETLCSAQRGDVQAQSILMNDLYTPVYHFLLKRTGNNSIADELCQTVFLKCYQRLNHYDSKAGTVYTWVFTIARNTLIDFFKKHKDEILDNPQYVQAEDSASDTTYEAQKRIDGEYITKILQQLEPEEADIVVLRAIDEMSYKKIAGIVAKSPEAIRKIYSRALAKLREAGKEVSHNQPMYE